MHRGAAPLRFCLWCLPLRHSFLSGAAVARGMVGGPCAEPDDREQTTPALRDGSLDHRSTSMLAEPNDESPANIDAAKQWRTDREAFAKMARRNVRQSLGVSVARHYEYRMCGRIRRQDDTTCLVVSTNCHPDAPMAA